ncbi:MAG TPA: transglycosylase domain-containing protein [Pseudonocardiaceae bacterium]
MRVTKALLKLVGLCVLAGVLLAGMLFPAAGGLGLASNQASDTVDSVSAELVEGQLPLVTTLLNAAGAPMAWLYDQYRVPVNADQIAPAMKAAIIAIEDRRFFEHQGVDWRGTTRALVTNQLKGEVAQGGSTLTMQYVKNYLLYVVAKDEAERARVTEQTPARKLREIRIATQLESQLSKEEILARYLNIVFFGNNSYGVAAAASTYFGTTPDKLSVAQSALLAGMVKSTTQFDPVRKPEEALKRRNLVVDLMAEIGSIGREAAEQAKAEPLGVVNPLRTLPNGCVGAGPAAGFFCKYVLNYLAAAGISEEQLKRGGYIIKTTMDPRATDLAKHAAEDQVAKTTDGIADTMAIVQPGKERHRVIALVANRDFGLDKAAGQTSYALPSDTSKFGAGSIYKIFTAAAALEKGMGINWELDTPDQYVSPTCPKVDGKPYTVKNAAEGYKEKYTMQDALATSPNTAFVKLIESVGVAPAVDMASRLGMRQAMNGINRSGDPLKPGEKSRGQTAKDENQCSFTLGPGPTGALELANVAATLMSGGVWCPPSPLESVTDSRTGKAVAVRQNACEQAVPEGLANTLVIGLSKDDTAGTAVTAARAVAWDRPMLGKTGTTQQQQSAGFVGATPQYAGAVLTFADGNNPQGICDGDPPRLCPKGNIFGGRIPARTWFAAMKPLHEGLPVAPLPAPDPVYVDGNPNNAVPNVIGRSYGEAKAILEAKGYRVAQRTTDSAAPKGIVVNQSPRGNALPGFVITLYVSNGSVQVPPPTPPGQGGDPGNGGGGGGGGGPGPPGGGGTPGTFGYGPIRGFGF